MAEDSVSPLGGSALRELLGQRGIVPRRHLGQNFLVDGQVIDRVLKVVREGLGGEASSAVVVEIGPGLGALTRGLLQIAGSVVGVEVDRRMAAYLRGVDWGSGGRFRLLEEDAVKFPLGGMEREGHPVEAVLSNLPFAITSPWIDAVLECGQRAPRHLFLILQKEAAERLGAEVGTRAAGALTTRFGLVYHRTLQWRVGGGSFYPVPGVDSVFGYWVRRDDALFLHKETAQFLRVAFNNRRKVLRKAIEGHLAKAAAGKWAFWLQEHGYLPDVRAEALRIEDWKALNEIIVN